jgi:hypothetical protein
MKWEKRVKRIIPDGYIFHAVPYFFRSDASP